VQTEVSTPHAVFWMPQRLMVPLFQRRYVWNEAAQWEPLWQDIVRVSERRVTRSQEKPEPHFLGAVVVQQLPHSMGKLPVRTIIDGQQRLTTRAAPPWTACTPSCWWPVPGSPPLASSPW
jgi:uncharacterized protein with ParB-like and HNH nuclease domain